MEKNDKKYGLFTGITMVIGSVIGSGAFFKAETIGRITGDAPYLGIYAWIAGGIVMMLCLYAMAALSDKCGKGGLCSIAENVVGKGYSYFVGWFMATIYYPCLVSVLSYLSARYSLMFAGTENTSGNLCMLLSLCYMTAGFVLNAFSPVLAGKFQVVTTGIKLVPLVLMIIFGLAGGISENRLAENLSGINSVENPWELLFGAIIASLFAYEGWISVCSIGNEMKNSRRNLPLSMLVGGIAVMAVYVLYYMGILGTVSVDVLINYEKYGVKTAFSELLGNKMGELLIGFVAVSCIGALNGTIMGCGRAMNQVATLGKGPFPNLFLKRNRMTGMPSASFAAGFIFSCIRLLLSFEAGIFSSGILSRFNFEGSELPVVTIYAMYIPIFFFALKKEVAQKNYKKVLTFVLSIVSCLFVIGCSLIAVPQSAVNYLFTFVSVMLGGFVFFTSKEQTNGEQRI